MSPLRRRRSIRNARSLSALASGPADRVPLPTSAAPADGAAALACRTEWLERRTLLSAAIQTVSIDGAPSESWALSSGSIIAQFDASSVPTPSIIDGAPSGLEAVPVTSPFPTWSGGVSDPNDPLNKPGVESDKWPNGKPPVDGSVPPDATQSDLDGQSSTDPNGVASGSDNTSGGTGQGGTSGDKTDGDKTDNGTTDGGKGDGGKGDGGKSDGKDDSGKGDDGKNDGKGDGKGDGDGHQATPSDSGSTPSTGKPPPTDAGDGGPHQFPPLNGGGSGSDGSDSPSDPATPTPASPGKPVITPSTVGGSGGSNHSGNNNTPDPAPDRSTPVQVARSTSGDARVAVRFSTTPVSAESVSRTTSDRPLTTPAPASVGIFADRAPAPTVVVDGSYDTDEGQSGLVGSRFVGGLARQATLVTNSLWQMLAGVTEHALRGDGATPEVVDLDALRAAATPGAIVLGLARHRPTGRTSDWVWKVTAGVSLAVAIGGYWYCSEVAAREDQPGDAERRRLTPLALAQLWRREVE